MTTCRDLVRPRGGSQTRQDLPPPARRRGYGRGRGDPSRMKRPRRLRAAVPLLAALVAGPEVAATTFAFGPAQATDASGSIAVGRRDVYPSSRVVPIVSGGGDRFEVTRRLQEAAATGGEPNPLFSQGEEDHDDHDHGASDIDDHEGHDHGASVESEGHDNHDHGVSDGDDHDDHEGHDHGEETASSFSSANDGQTKKTPWGPVIGATLLVNLATLAGVLLVVLAAVQRGLLKLQGKESSDAVVGHGTFFDVCIPAFAVGALIATAVFLIFPEALHLIEGAHGADAHADHSDHEEEGEDHSGHNHRLLQEEGHAGHDDSSEGVNAAKFGCAILGGFLLPLVFSIVLHTPKADEDVSVPNSSDEEMCASCRVIEAEAGVSVAKVSEEDETGGVLSDTTFRENEAAAPQDGRTVDVAIPEQAPDSFEPKPSVDKQLCASILLGDSFHNFADGVFIGAAFKGCSTGTAVSILLVTLFHEIAQELADFILLTRFAGLSVLKAIVLNFLSGLSVCLGGIVFLAGNPSDEATGIILAMAGGVYFNIAGCETMPRLEQFVKSRVDRILVLFFVIVGIIPIGLILLNHEHC
ncbi:hypothetical protein ACHAWF_005131 [Thalassiosira exigua]